MKLLDELRTEHDLIDAVLGSFRTWVTRRAAGDVDAADGPRFVRFFRLYAGDFHHEREEDILFEALHHQAELPADRGPIAVLAADHGKLAAVLDEMAPLLEAGVLAPGDAARLEHLAKSYAEGLWHHIDAENSVLLPESEARLRRHGVTELPTRPMSAAEAEARAIGEALRSRYPATADPMLMRGDGCVMCPAFVDACRGLEREWWNEWEWDEFEDHLPSG